MPEEQHQTESPAAQPRGRLVPRGDALKVVRTGTGKVGLTDLYVQLLDAPWRVLAALIATFYLSANVVFASLYLSLGNAIENARAGSFQDAFFFSVQTMATIGYGKLIPVGLYANILVTLEALFGFGFFAVITGLVFAKFSRPTARVLFSDVAVIHTYEGQPHLMLRLANQRNNRIVESSIQLVMLRNQMSKEGHNMRRFYDLQPVRAKVPFLQLTWTVMHPINEQSPLYNMTPEMLKECNAEIIVTLVGMDETLSQTVHARQSYVQEEIIFDAVFEDILKRNENGAIEVNYHLMHKVKKV